MAASPLRIRFSGVFLTVLHPAANGPNLLDDAAASELFDEICHARQQLR